jgi:aminopeptidase N/puromycin-sensitive aminopeptidase
MILSGVRRIVPCLLLVMAATAWSQRLSQTVVPEHYTLQLTPDVNSATFTGVESIDVLVKEPADEITLNAIEIKFNKVTATMNGQELAATVTEDTGKQQATFHFDHTLPAGAVTLHIDYSGILNGELRGFYLSKTATQRMAVTQFEPTDARRAFPSFDEPAFKATFSVTLVTPKGDMAISNTNSISDTPGPGPDQHTVKFATTPKMSTYLVAFLVGKFECISGQSDGTPIRVCATPGKTQYAHFALSGAEFFLHYYDQYFGIKYPMPKLDLVGIPDFEAGAMENFGCITFRETALLVNPETATVDEEKHVAIDVAHEMAHQWFGDMVTMQWWNNIWLNEGFATWMESKAAGAWKPEWHLDQDNIGNGFFGLNGTLNYDAQRITRAIRADANTPDQINQMFDAISYGKAAAVLAMTENYETPETFRRGVHNYLEAHMWGNATAENFWEAQAAASHLPVDKILESFIAEPGEPMLSFNKPSRGKVEASQKRFFLNSTNQATTPQTWTIPVCFAEPDAEQKCDVMSSAEQRLAAPQTSPFFPDARGDGYYRYSLPESVYRTLAANAETKLTPTERISLLGNEWAEVHADKASVGDYLDLVSAVKDDPNAAVIGEAVGPLGTIANSIASNAQEREALAAWVRTTFKPAWDKLGAPAATDTPNKKELRATMFGVLGDEGDDPDVVAQAKKLASGYFSNPGSVDPDLAQTAASIAARHGDAAYFDELQHVYETENNPQIKELALGLMSEFRDPALERRSLEYAISGKVRNQDAIFEFMAPMQQRQTREVAWDFIQQNWSQVQGQFTKWMGAYLVGATGSFCSEQKKQEVVSFFAAHPVPASNRALQRAEDSIGDCVQLRTAQEPSLQQWAARQ